MVGSGVRTESSAVRQCNCRIQLYLPNHRIWSRQSRAMQREL